MDTQFWIWVIIVVITLLARGLGKKKAAPRPGGEAYDDLDEPARPSAKPMTFEELLREIQASKAPPKPAPAPERRQPEFVDYDDDIRPEEEDLEQPDFDYKKQDDIYKVYEEAKQQAFARPSLETTEADTAGREIRFEHFRTYEEERSGPNFDFLAELKDPQGFRKAFIMSEILNRKY